MFFISEIIKKIKVKYESLSIQAKASIWFVICNCLQKATQIITTPIYTRILSTKQYGEYTVFLSWVELVAIITTLDIFYSGFNVGMEKFNKDRKNYVSSMHGLCIALTSIWAVLGFTFSKNISLLTGLSPLHVKLLFGYMYVYPIYLFWSAQKKYDYNYKPLLLVTLLSSIFTILVGSIVATKFVDKSSAVIIAKIVIELIIAIPLFSVSINGFKSLINKYYWIYALKFNIPLIPHYLSTMILNHSDRIMILNICGASNAAIYSVAYSIAMLMTIVQNAINSAITPWLYNKLSNQSYAGIKKIIIQIIFIVAILNILLIGIAPEIVNILSSNAYYEAIWIIPPVSFGVFLTCIYGFFVNVELYYGNNWIAAIASLLAALTNLILNYIFINRYGYIAAGYTTLLSYLILTVVHYVGLKYVCKKNLLEMTYIFSIKTILLIVFAFACVACVFMFLYENVILRYLIIIIILGTIFKQRNKIIIMKNRSEL